MTESSSSETALSLTEELRQKTKSLHGKTDRLVQLGLFTVLDYQIYRQILLGFYYVFSTFEEEYERHVKSPNAHPWLTHAYSPDLKRTEAFEADLAYFYGSDWKDHVHPSKQVQEYMDHIRDISKHHPEKLVAFPATLYLGLFFGGQITRSRILKSTHFFPSPPEKKIGGEHDDGIAIFAFREKIIGDTSMANTSSAQAQEINRKRDPNKVKKALKAQLNSIPGIDSETETTLRARQSIVEEAKEIFIRNMDLMTSVEGVSRVWTRWILNLFWYLAITIVIGVALHQIFTQSA